MVSEITLASAIDTANTGLDAIKRAPIVEEDTGIKCLRIQDVSQSKSFDNWGFTEVTSANFSKFQLKKDDIMIARTGGSVGVNRFIFSDAQSVFNNGLIRIRVKNEKFYPKYIYYLLQTDSFKSHIEAIAYSTSAQPNMKIRDLLRFTFIYQNLINQKDIAYILSSLDKKIELNRQINETLEAMAQALFKSWFVDFDPVIDNALVAGNPIPDEFVKRAEQRKAIQHSDSNNQAIRTLFPDEFEFTEEMGWIPKGWTVSDVGTEFNSVGGGTPSTKNSDFWEEGSISWTTPKDLSGNQSKILLNTDRKITELGLKKISSGLLPIDTVLMSSRAPVGYLAIAKVPVAINQGYIALKCEKILTPEFAIQWADAIMDEIKQRAGGTTFAEITKKSFRTIPILVPDESIISTYSKHVKNLYNQITSRIENIDTLSKLRDTLLPKLLSGELRIPDAAILVEDA